MTHDSGFELWLHRDIVLNNNLANNAASLSTTADADLELLRRVAGKDRDAFETLYYQYYRRVVQFVFRFCRNETLAEEVVNDTLFTVWQDAARFEARSRVSTWIFGIAYRKAIKAIQRYQAPVQESVDEPDLSDVEQPDSVLSQQQTQDWLQSGLDQLSPEHRSVVELSYYHGYAYHEIAEIVDCPVNTVKTRMFHARKKLKKILPVLNDATNSSHVSKR